MSLLLETQQLLYPPRTAPVSLSLTAGEIVGLAGPSGCGKSRLLRFLAGLEPPDAGRILYRGATLPPDLSHYRRQVMLLPQRPILRPGTLQQDWEWVCQLKAYRSHQLPPPNWQQWKNGFSQMLHNQLSGGEQQVAVLLRALALNPEVLLLDEPTAAMDPATTARAEDWVCNWFTPERAVLWISHDPQQLKRLCHRVIYLDGL